MRLDVLWLQPWLWYHVAGGRRGRRVDGHRRRAVRAFKGGSCQPGSGVCEDGSPTSCAQCACGADGTYTCTACPGFDGGDRTSGPDGGGAVGSGMLRARGVLHAGHGPMRGRLAELLPHVHVRRQRYARLPGVPQRDGRWHGRRGAPTRGWRLDGAAGGDAIEELACQPRLPMRQQGRRPARARSACAAPTATSRAARARARRQWTRARRRPTTRARRLQNIPPQACISRWRMPTQVGLGCSNGLPSGNGCLKCACGQTLQLMCAGC